MVMRELAAAKKDLEFVHEAVAQKVKTRKTLKCFVDTIFLFEAENVGAACM